MQLTVVGCSGSFPGPDAPASCYLIEAEGSRLLLDMGNGSLGALQRYVDIYDLDAVLISHLHVDHFVDLCSYYVARKYRPGGPAGLLPVYGPKGTAARLLRTYGKSPDTDISGQLDIRRLERHFAVGPFRITTMRMAHPIETYAIRVEAGGRVLTYSADTGPTPDLALLAEDCDVALFEASFLTSGDNPAGLHLTGADAARAARDADAERLVLTHLVPWNDPAQVLAEATAILPAAQLARPGLVIAV